MSTPTISNFDYSALPEDLAGDCHRAVHDYHALQKRTVQGMAAIGLQLIAIRERLEHGQFLKWLEAEFGSKSSAYRLINIAESFEPAILPTLGSLDLTAVHALATAPAPVRQEIVGKLAKGEHLPSPMVKIMVSEGREAERKAKEDAKLSPEERKQRELKERRQRKSREQREAEWAHEAERARKEIQHRIASARNAVDLLRKHLDPDELRKFAELVQEGQSDFPDALAEAVGLKVSGLWISRTTKFNHGGEQ